MFEKVNNSKELSIPVSGKTVAKNTVYNLIGYGIPLVFAVVLIPPLINGLGEEKFGILSLCWVVIGYFSFLDFGIGRSLTKIVAEKIGLNQTKEIPGIFWTSFFLMLTLSSIGAVLLLFISPLLIQDFFKISENLQEDTLYAFYILALSIPIVATTAGLRGVLEAYQKFGLINIIRVNLGVFTFLAPLLCLFFTDSLFWIVLVLSIIRAIVWIIYLFQCFSINTEIRSNKTKFDGTLVKPILRLSGWMTVSNLVGPMIIYLDRFLIGALISAVAITYYTTPYEVVTKLLLVPGALTGVLFPAFSSSYLSNPEITKKLFVRGVKFIFIFLYPIVLILITFSYEGMNLWLGQNFAENSSLVLQLLALGVLFNSIAYIPFTFLQGIGKPKIPALVNLFELPFYCVLMWFAISKWGISGAAVIWVFRIVVDTSILFIFTIKLTSSQVFKFSRVLLVAFLMFLLIISISLADITLKIFFVTTILLIFSLLVWKVFLSAEEKGFLVEKIKFFKFSFKTAPN